MVSSFLLLSESVRLANDATVLKKDRKGSTGNRRPDHVRDVRVQDEWKINDHSSSGEISDTSIENTVREVSLGSVKLAMMSRADSRGSKHRENASASNMISLAGSGSSELSFICESMMRVLNFEDKRSGA